VALLKKFEDNRKDNGVFSLEIKKMWEESFAETSPTTSILIHSPWYYSLAENFIKYNEYAVDSFSFDKSKEKYRKGLRHTHNIEESTKHLTSNMLEFYNAAYLFHACLQKKYEKELITLFEDFKTDFPNSEYFKYLEPMVSPIVEFHIKKEKPFDEDIKFIEDYENINSLKESVISLRGKKVFIDVWATWCGPCKAEFEHKVELKKLLASKNIELLYISIDLDKYDTQWQDMIKFYNLEGYHIRANQELGNDLRRIFDRNGSISIPWYILIDGNGNIIKEHASRPSQLKKLEKEITEK
jgi:thiol-disulfide isomerase/thioredoxin